MSDTVHLSGCGCCAGTDVDTPAVIDNAPGLDAVAYRVGTHATFKESIQARLSSSDFAALAALRSRDNDDFTLALADGFAVMADVLTFYQERIANEAFLRSSTERRSVLELARLLGYELDPGVAADAWLAFTLEAAPGAPAEAARPVAIAPDTKVQSVPGPDEAPQTFETVAAITARVDRNAIPVQTRERQLIGFGDTELYLLRTGQQLDPGDIVLIVGAERRRYRGSENWDVRVVRAVEPDDRRGVTRITWVEPLGHVTPRVEPATEQTEVFVFRQRAALFGHNAPSPWLLSTNGTNLANLANLATGQWNNYQIQDQRIDLDQQYPKVVAGGWIALVSAEIRHQPSSLPGYVELYNAVSVGHRSRTDFGLSSKVTRVDLDTGEHLDWFGLPDTLVLAQSEALPLAERPIRAPLYGDRVALASVVPDLLLGQPMAVTGARQHVRVAAGARGLELLVGAEAVQLQPGDRLELAAAPTRALSGNLVEQLEPDELMAAIDADGVSPLGWTLIGVDGRTGTLEAGADAFELDPATKDDPIVSEVATVAVAADGVEQDRERTRLRLSMPLRGVYDRETMVINANVAPATHGETVSEILGSGDAAHADQEFPLKQVPLTYVSAVTPTGRRSTLTVRVNDTLWEERDTLYGAGERDRAFTTRTNDDATTTVVFGDGVEGARLPSGTQNLRASYRKGLGAAGNVRSGQLTTLLTRPLGVTGVINPEAAAGGEEPESIDDARRNAPLTVLTLGRAVSRRDYEDFARSFAGIAKAHALWIPSGPARGVFITVAGPLGVAIAEGGTTQTKLVAALRASGDPLLPLDLRTYRAASFLLRARIKVADDAVAEDVVADVRASLEAVFGFDARDFGQSVSIDEVVAVIHRSPSVVAVDVDELRRTDQAATPAVRARLVAALPEVSGATVTPAEILTLDAAALDIQVMP
jgi:Baseplate J-like protein